MSGYRFCRTDDVPLLVDAYNRCVRPHFEGEPPMTVDGFKRLTREIDLWASSCMVAFANDEPIGVLLSAKRDTGSIVLRIGVHPDHQRQGHGRHLLESLANKLAILGPPRLEVELAEDSPARVFFEACGYRAESTYTDFARPTAGPDEEPARGVIPVTMDELLESGAFDPEIPRSWERSLPTLRNRANQIEGLAIASDVRVEAYLLHWREPVTGRREIVAFGHADGETAPAFLGVLVRHLGALSSGPLFAPRVSRDEIDFDRLAMWKFLPAGEVIALAAPVPVTA